MSNVATLNLLKAGLKLAEELRESYLDLDHFLKEWDGLSCEQLLALGFDKEVLEYLDNSLQSSFTRHSLLKSCGSSKATSYYAQNFILSLEATKENQACYISEIYRLKNTLVPLFCHIKGVF